VESVVSLTAQHPVIANRARWSATWHAWGGASVTGSADAAKNTLDVGWAQGGTGNGSALFALQVDVYRQPQRTEIVRCNVANAESTPLTIAGQTVAPNASRWVDVSLAPVATATWQSATFSATSTGGRLAVGECRIQVMAPSPRAVAPSRTVR
jgi:hypothetical protein